MGNIFRETHVQVPESPVTGKDNQGFNFDWLLPKNSKSVNFEMVEQSTNGNERARKEPVYDQNGTGITKRESHPGWIDYESVERHEIDPKMGDEWTKLLNMLKNSVKLEDKLAIPFGEEYYLNKEFMDAAYEKFLEINLNVSSNDADFKTLRQVEMKYRLEELKKRVDPQVFRQYLKKKRFLHHPMFGTFLRCFQIPRVGERILIHLIIVEYDEYIKKIWERNKDNEKEFERLKDACVQDLSEFADIVLCEDYESKGFYAPKNALYCTFDPYNLSVPFTHFTILHLAAQRDLVQIASTYMRIYPLSVYEPDAPLGRSSLSHRIPVEVALDQGHDNVCHLIMKKMMNLRVCNFFTPDYYASRQLRARYSLGHLVAKGDMPKTVIAVLDACVSPALPCLTTDWSYLPIEKERELEERLWPTEPSADLRYRYSYQILECDLNGRTGTDSDSGSPTTFHIISTYGHTDSGEGAAKHMLFRNLIRTKWKLYGRNIVMLHGLLYLFFILCLSTALFTGGTLEDPTCYRRCCKKEESLTPTQLVRRCENEESLTHVVRMITEITSLAFTVLYLMTEIHHIIWKFMVRIKSKCALYMKWSKICPLSSFVYIIGLLMVLSLAPLQVLGHKREMRLTATFAYLILTTQLSYYFALHTDLGIYANTFKDIIRVDIVQFLVVILFVVFVFTGGIFIAVCALEKPIHLRKNFTTILIRLFRAFMEGKEFEEDYDEHHYPIFVICLILVSMFFIMVIMGNLLIGQISDKYARVKSKATVQCEVDRAKMLTRIERFPFIRSRRKEYYISAMYVRHEEMERDLKEDATCYCPKGKPSPGVESLISQHILKWD